jgi:hypothetical protein
VKTKGRFPTREAALFLVDMLPPRHHTGEGRAHLRDRDNYALPAVTTAFPTGPRPSPGWCWGVRRRDPQILSLEPGKSKKKAASQREAAQRSGQRYPKIHPGEGRGPVGDRGNYVLPAFSTAFPTGPRPPPGWCWGLAPLQAYIRSTESETAPPHLSVRAGRRRGVAASGGGRGGAAGPDRRDRNARRSRGSPGSPCHRKSGNRARPDGRAAICRCGR